MPSPDTPTRKLAAIMFTDITGYTALSAKDSLKASELLKTQKDTLKPIIEEHGGSWIKEMGDGLLLTFDSATSAVECAIAIQGATKDMEDLNLRIGIHEGEVIKQDGDVIGDDVNVASRIEPFSAVGGVAISHKVQQAISSNQEFDTKYVGTPKLKGVSQKVEVYCITSHGLPETKLSYVSAKLEKKTNWFRYAVSAVVVVAILTYYFIPKEKEVPSIGILMMENLGFEEDNFWSRGITEDLIVKVAGAGLIRVAPMKEILEIDIQKSFEEIAKKLRVKYLLTSSMHKKEDSFDLRCQLIEAESGVSTYAKKWSEVLDNSPTIVGNLADDILKTLKVSSKQEITKTHTTNPEAYEYYLRAKYKWEKRENMEDVERARGLIKKAIDIDDDLITAKILLGSTYTGTSDYDKAMEIYENSLKQAEELSDKKGIAKSLNGIGAVYYSKSDYDKALDYYERSLKIREGIGDKDGIGSSVINIGKVYSRKGDYDKALDYYTRSLQIKGEIGYKRGMGHSLKSIGFVYWNKGDYDKALDYFERSLKIDEELGNKFGMEYSLRSIGIVYAGIGDIDKALDYFIRSLEIAEEISDKRGMAYSLENIGIVYYSSGDLETALEYLEKSLGIQKEIELGGTLPLSTTTYLYLTYKHLGKGYDEKEIHRLIKKTENIEFELNYHLYQLLEDTSYFETAHNQIQEKADDFEPDVKAKFISYPIPSSIVEEWENTTN